MESKGLCMIEATRPVQEMKEFFEANPGKIFTMISKITEQDIRTYIFEYKDVYYSYIWECPNIACEMIVPGDLRKHLYYYLTEDAYSNELCFDDNDYVRLANEKEIRDYLNIKQQKLWKLKAHKTSANLKQF